MAPSNGKIDKAILKLVAEHSQPITLKNIMHHLERQNLHEGKSFRTVSDRVYALRREGTLVQVDQGQNARYDVPAATREAITERAKQLDEARRREQEQINQEEPASTTPTTVESLGECTAVDMGDCWMITPKHTPQPTIDTAIVLDSRELTPVPPALPTVDTSADLIAQHIGTTVTLTIKQLIGEALASSQTTIRLQSQEITKLGQALDEQAAKNTQLAEQLLAARTEIREQEELYTELDTKHMQLKRQIVGLAQS